MNYVTSTALQGLKDCGDHVNVTVKDKDGNIKEIAEELKTLGNLVKIEPLHHSVGHCYRCNHTVEPIVSKQWFVKMEEK